MGFVIPNTHLATPTSEISRLGENVTKKTTFAISKIYCHGHNRDSCWKIGILK